MLPGLVPFSIPPKLRVSARWTKVPANARDSGSKRERRQSDYGVGLDSALEDGKIVTVRIRDDVRIGSFSAPGAVDFERAGFAVWTKEASGRTSGPFDLRDGRAMSEDTRARFGSKGQYDFVQKNYRERGSIGDFFVTRRDADPLIPPVWLCQMELGFAGFLGTGDGPYAFCFEGSNTWNVGWRLITTRLQPVTSSHYLLYGVSIQGFLVSLKIAGQPLGDFEQPGRPGRDLTLIDPASGRVRWTRPMISSKPVSGRRGAAASFSSGVPIVETDRGVVVLHPKTGRTLLTQPWPKRRPLYGTEGLFFDLDSKGESAFRYRLDIRIL